MSAGAAAPRPDAGGEGLEGATDAGVRLRQGDLSGRVFCCDGAKGIADDPIARAGGMNVVEEAENARAVRGTGGEGVGVEQIVAAAQRQVAAFFLLRAEAGVVELPVGRHRAQKAGEECGDRLRVVAQDAAQVVDRSGLCGLGVNAGELVGFGLVGDVLVQ